MRGRQWPAEDDAKLAELIRSGKTNKEAAKELGLTLSQVDNKVRRLDLTGVRISRVISETPERMVYAPEDSAEQEAEDLWADAVKATKRRVAKCRTEGLARTRLLTDRPVAFSISSDWHITASGACDLEGLDAYARAIQQAPGAYAIGVGDLTDNPIKWEKEMGDVPKSAVLLDRIFGVFGSKLLATTDGNHDAWSRAFSGLDNVRTLTRLAKVHYAPDELIHIVELASPKEPALVTATYVVATRHQYRRNSSLNWTHACWRWLEDNLNDWPKGEDGGVLLPDILAIGHNHSAEVANRSYEGGERWAARMGPFQIHSGHARQYGWSRGVPRCPTFLLYPHRAKPIKGFAHYQDALEVLASERAERAAA